MDFLLKPPEEKKEGATELLEKFRSKAAERG